MGLTGQEVHLNEETGALSGLTGRSQVPRGEQTRGAKAPGATARPTQRRQLCGTRRGEAGGAGRDPTGLSSGLRTGLCPATASMGKPVGALLLT